MRTVFFAILLVAASFAGGAAVNGPGLQWAREMLLKPPEVASADSVTPAPAAATAPADPHPTPPLVLESGVTAPGPEAQPRGKKDGAAPPAVAETVPAGLDPAVVKASMESPRPDAKDPGRGVGLGILAEATPPLDPPAPLASSEELERDAKPLDAPGRDAPGPAPAAAAAVPPRPPAPAPAPTPAPAIAPAPAQPVVSAPAPASAPGAPEGWAEVRRTMRDLGVARYGIEGEPGGRVRFHCVIPLAGRRAVAQQFEAEGDDDLQAARSALRRVALWRATEGPRP